MQGEVQGRNYDGPDYGRARGFPPTDPRAIPRPPPAMPPRPTVWPRLMRVLLFLSGWMAFGLLWLMD